MAVLMRMPMAVLMRMPMAVLMPVLMLMARGRRDVWRDTLVGQC